MFFLSPYSNFLVCFSLFGKVKVKVGPASIIVEHSSDGHFVVAVFFCQAVPVRHSLVLEVFWDAVFECECIWVVGGGGEVLLNCWARTIHTAKEPGTEIKDSILGEIKFLVYKLLIWVLGVLHLFPW